MIDLPVIIPVKLKYLTRSVRRLFSIESIQAGLKSSNSGVVLWNRQTTLKGQFHNMCCSVKNINQIWPKLKKIDVYKHFRSFRHFNSLTADSIIILSLCFASWTATLERFFTISPSRIPERQRAALIFLFAKGHTSSVCVCCTGHMFLHYHKLTHHC